MRLVELMGIDADQREPSAVKTAIAVQGVAQVPLQQVHCAESLLKTVGVGLEVLLSAMLL